MKIARLITGLIIAATLAACSPAPEEKQQAKSPTKKTQKVKPSTFSILAFSWQPAFCEGNSRKPECKTQTASRFDATHFALHGLWPKGAYCGVDKITQKIDKDGAWGKLSKLELTRATRTELQRVMPGYTSNLQRHEWIKHGTCYGGATADEYYADSLHIMDQLNGSKLQTLFAENIGKRVTKDDIQQALDESFGNGAGLRARVKCRRDKNSNRNLITEITVALSGEITPNSRVADLLLAARPDNKEGCPGGIVDPVGLQ